MKTSIRTQMATLATLAGLDNTEKAILCQLHTTWQQKRSLSHQQINCLKAMASRHLGGRHV